MTAKDDPYLALLRYGKEHLVEDVTIEEAQDHLRSLGFELERFQFRDLFGNTFRRTSSSAPEGGMRYAMSIEAYFQLLEFEELSEARETSKQAKTLSWLAIFIASGLAFVALGLQAASLLIQGGESEIQRLDEGQLEQILTALEAARLAGP